MTISTGIEYTHRARQAIVPLDSVQALLINTANDRQNHGSLWRQSLKYRHLLPKKAGIQRQLQCDEKA
jgi:hypothetical protein